MRKNILLTLFSVFSTTLFGQSGKPPQDILVKHGVTVTGKTFNAKAGAIIKTDTTIYYVNGLNHWPDDKNNKSITVTGDLYKSNALMYFEGNDTGHKQGIPVKDSAEYKKGYLILKNVTFK